MSKNNKLNDFINQWIDKKKEKSDETSKNHGEPQKEIKNSGINRFEFSEKTGIEIGISRQRTHQKLTEYEIEILQGKIKKKYEELGELVYRLLEENKRIQKNSQEMSFIRSDLIKLFKELKEKKKGKRLDGNFFDQPVIVHEKKVKNINAKSSKSKIISSSSGLSKKSKKKSKTDTTK